MIEIEYEGPPLRGLLVMVLALVAGIVMFLAADDRDATTWQGWGVVVVAALGAIGQIIDAHRWSQEPADEDDR